MGYKPVTHVIFDMDGTLLDTEPLYHKVITGVLKTYGKVYTKELCAKITGRSASDGSRVLVDELELPITPEQLVEKFSKKYPKALRNAAFRPGVEKLVYHLNKNKIPFAIATSSRDEEFKIKIAHQPEFFSMFDHVVMPSHPEVKHGKPHPDIFLVCASLFPNPPKPEDCLVFEDAIHGIHGAISAGMQAVFIPSIEKDKEAAKDATLMLNSMTEFRPQLFGLPAFASCKCKPKK